MGTNLMLVCHTTDDISSLGRVRELATGLMEVSGDTDLRVSWDEPPDFVKARTARYRSLRDAKLTEIYAQGGIVLSDLEAGMLRASIEWNKLRGLDAQSFLRTRGYVQNRIAVHANARLLDDPVSKARYLELAKRLAVGFNVSLLYVYDPSSWDARYAGKSGLSVGLRDLYWVTVFGASFVEIIGRDRLLACPAKEVEALTSEMIFLRVTDAFFDPKHPSVRESYETVRNCIGGRFFAKCHLERAPEVPSSGWLLNPRRLLQLRRFFAEAKQQFEDDSISADICPTFDWTNIFLDQA